MDVVLFDLSLWQIIGIIIAAFLIGFSKTGIGGASMLAIPLIASIAGGKNSTGIMLLLLIAGDIFATLYYKKHTKWGNIFKIMPWNVVGLVLGTFVGNQINDSQFKMLIAVSVLVCIVILVYGEVKRNNYTVPNKMWIYILLGITCGFTSMIGNAAGPIFTVYMLALGFKKNDFMGTTAGFFFINNLIKVPLQVFVWGNIGGDTLLLTAQLLPAIAIGAVIGVVVLKKINEKAFRYIIIAMTVIAAVRLFL